MANRIVPRVHLDRIVLGDLLVGLGVPAQAFIAVPEGGLIATSVRITVGEAESVVVRAYPRERGRAALEFEVECLEFLAERGMPVPQPRCFRDGQKIRELENAFVIAYNTLPGRSLRRDDLSVPIASQAGATLGRLLEHSLSFRPKHRRPAADLDFIRALLVRSVAEHPQLSGSVCVAGMHEQLYRPDMALVLDSMPSGLVHADYYFANVLVNDDRVTGVIDFGDAYYGKVVMDLAIGAMEFSVLEDEHLELGLLCAFLEPLSRWLRAWGVSANVFHWLLLVNCVRFGALTLPLAADSGDSMEQNPYFRRFENILSPESARELTRCFDEVIRRYS